MKIRDLIPSFFARACCASVALSTVFYIFMEIAYSTSLDVVNGIAFGQFLLLFLCAALLAGASYLFLLPLPRSVNVLLTYITNFLSLFIVFNAAGKTLSFLPTLLIFTLFYAIFFGILFLFRLIFYPEKRREKTKAEEKKEAEYVNRF